ncbi:MAG: tetratricopeptide repeat protein [Gemmatimonadaceae bacterium]
MPRSHRRFSVPSAHARRLHAAAWAAAAAALTVAALPAAALAQRPVEGVARGDSLFRRGRVFAAESAYYDAARHTPRDPAARLALGRYLASRGALRIGAVLMEEARFFGGDPRTIGLELAPVYARLGDYRSLAALPGSPLSAAERARAEWLRDHPPAAEGPDSVTVAYEPQGAAGAAGGLGRVTLALGGESVVATIDPAVRGLVLDSAWLRRTEAVKAFPPRVGGKPGADAPAVAIAPKLGAMTLANVPTRLAPLGGVRSARVGLDVLSDLAATFDEPGRTLTLRRAGRLAPAATGTHLATISLPSGVWLATAAGTTALAVDRGRAPLRGKRWTVDRRRGEIVVQ